MTDIKTKSHDLKVIKKDQLTFVIESEKTKGETSMYKGYILNRIDDDILNKKDGYLVVQGEFSAHGEDLKGALLDLQHKINLDNLAKEPIYNDTIITIERYHALTGACVTGIKNWMEQTNTSEGLRVDELLPILEKHNAYGVERFKQLITN